MSAVVYKLMHDFAACLAAVLGHQAVQCFLEYIWGCCTTILVIFDLILNPMRIRLLCEQQGFLPHDSTPSPESNLGNIV